MWLGKAARMAVSAGRAGTGPATTLVDVLPFDNEQLSYREVAAVAMAVDSACRGGDHVAAALCDEAVRCLVDLLLAHDAMFTAGPVLTVGSAVGPGSAVRDRFRCRIEKEGLTLGEHRADLSSAAVRWALLQARTGGADSPAG